MNAALLELDATEQAHLVRSGAIEAVDLVLACQRAIETLNPALNAVITTSFERASEEARDADVSRKPFSGVPIVLKDILCQSAGDPYHCGMEALRRRNWVAQHDSALTRRFRRAGFIIVGRTNTPELAASATTEPASYGPTRNPWDLARSPGGSSGGSAAAVASRMVSVAHASDMAGSLRAPAGACGLVGLKPSRGRTSLAPDHGEHWGPFTQEGVLTRSVRDTAAILDLIAGAEPGDPYAAPPFSRSLTSALEGSPGRLRIGIRHAAPETGVEPDRDVGEALSEVAQLLEELGHDVTISSPPPLDEYDRVRHAAIVTGTGVANDIRGWSRRLGETLGPEDVEPPTWELAEIGFSATASRYVEALEYLQAYSRRMASWWNEGFDVLVTPTTPRPAFAIGELGPSSESPRAVLARIADELRYTAPFNATGQPAMSLPCAETSSGLPIGLQFVAASFREDLLIGLGAQLEQARPWTHRSPALDPK